MLSLLVFLGAMVLSLVVIDGVLAYVTGEDNRGNRILSGFFTILILYFVILAIMGTGSESGFVSDGIPFVAFMDKDTTLLSIMHNNFSLFITETAELITLLFLISFIEKILPTSSSNISFMIISRTILVLVGILANCFLISFIYAFPTYRMILTIIQCILSGAALILTPIMMVGKVLGISSNITPLSFIIDELADTAVGRALVSAVTRTAILMIGLMFYESHFGPISGILNFGIQIVYMIGPIVIMCIGISIMVKSMFK